MPARWVDVLDMILWLTLSLLALLLAAETWCIYRLLETLAALRS